jgi:hypothetical protein
LKIYEERNNWIDLIILGVLLISGQNISFENFREFWIIKLDFWLIYVIMMFCIFDFEYNVVGFIIMCVTMQNEKSNYISVENLLV